jgi:hypothetical protein
VAPTGLEEYPPWPYKWHRVAGVCLSEAFLCLVFLVALARLVIACQYQIWKMRFNTIVGAVALLSQHATAQQMLRFSCSRLTIERLDPLVSPGETPSPHTHQVGGGNSFNASMPPGTYDPVERSTCTSCTFAEDFSNYWTANLYFRARNGTLKRVPQMANMGLKADGGLTVYYIPPYDGKSKVTAFKPVRALIQQLCPCLTSLWNICCCSPIVGLPHAGR